MRALRYALPLIVLMTTTAGAQQHPNVERGYLPDKSYQLGDIDTVNVFNGTLNVNIPLGGRYPVNGDLSYQFTLSYATNTWEVGENKVTTYIEREPYVLERWDRWAYPARHMNAGFGWMLNFGKLIKNAFDSWTYLSPDGAQHAFSGTLHANNPAEVEYVPNPPGSDPAQVTYTRDGTYLRLRRFGNRLELDFPDGNVHVFDLQGNLSTIIDPFGNTITFQYQTRVGGDYAGSSKWVISDSTGRQHYVYFRPAPSYWELVHGTDVAHERIDFIDLAAFDGGRAEYHFNYASDGSSVHPDSVLLSRRCPHTEAALGQAVRVAMLEGIDLPEGLRYEMIYDLGSQTHCSELYADGLGNASGNLTQVTLTTGATINFGYRVYDYPVASGWETPAFGGDPAETMYFSTVPGIASRIVKEGATVLSETEYEPDRYAQHSQRRIVRRKSGHSIIDEVRHYFTTCVVLACGNGSEYGLPFIREGMPTEGPFLSTETFVPDAGGILVAKRSSYLIYEGDGNLNLPAMYDYGRNKRMQYAKTIFEDGKYTDVSYSEFDGLGKYRQADFNGNVAATGNQRTTFTNFNPARGTFNVADDGTYSGSFTMPAVSAPWLFNVHDVQRVTENGVTSTVESCFAATGFLTGRRTYAAFGASPTKQGKDLLAIFTPDDDGNVRTEQYLGGDAENSVQAPTGSTCLTSSAADNFRIEHRYASGSRKSSHFVDDNGSPLSHFILDTDIDANTGLVKARREASTVGSGGATNGDGLQTNLDYDALGRLILESPPNGSANRGARRRIAFSLNSTKVEIFEEAPHDAATPSVLRKRTFELDGLGRVKKEIRSIPGGATASRLWEYDGVGRLAWASSWGNQTPVKTLFDYDAFGRVTTLTAPDQTQTKFAYEGIRQTSSTSSVRTDEGQDTDATTTSEYDGYGRLLRVTDPGGIKTKYTYDVGGRLVEVCANEAAGCVQTRTFSYDNRGFMTGEQTPELGATGNGTASYKYDARGNVVRTTIGPALGLFDVKVEYDRAGRQKRVYQAGNDRTLKAFEYGASNSGSNYTNGRLTRAVRHNWLDSVGYDVQVIEDYTYGGRDGRVSNRVTSDSECLISSSTCNNLFSGTEKRGFTQNFTYDELGAVTSLDHPTCTIGDCAAAALPGHTVTNTDEAGWLKNVTWTSAPQAASIAYHDNGMTSKVTHANGVIDDILLNDLRIPRPHEIKTTNVIDTSACTLPTFTLQPQSFTITSNSVIGLTAKAEGQTGLTITYTWYRGTYPDTSTVAKTETLASGVLSQYQTPNLTATTSYWVKAANSCASAGTASQTATLTLCTSPSITTQPQNKTVTRSQSHTLAVEASGSGPLSYQWSVISGSTVTPIIGATASSVTVTPTTTTSYRVTISNTCGSVDSSTVVVTVRNPPTAPLIVTATSNGTTNTVTWSVSSSIVGIASYQVQRQDTMMFTVPMPGARTLTNGPSGVLPASAYLYRVRAIDHNGVAGPWSSYDLTTTVVITDDPLEPGVTEVKGAHVSELRQAIDAVRTRGGLGPMWQSYGAATGIISLGHITQMRTSLNEGRLALGLPEIEYTEVSLDGLMSVTYLNELRNGVK